MKQVEQVSVGGYAFTMEAEAAAVASAYFKELEDFYASSEVMEGIEERMAELLLEKIAPGGVVSRRDVDSVIEILGRPERLEAEGKADGAEKEASGPKEKRVKKLYRDLSRAKVGGVCSGLAIYTGVDVVIYRLAFVVLTLLTIFLTMRTGDTGISVPVPAAYLIMWIAMPAARTVRQRWEQNGESGSVDDISRNVSGGGTVGGAIKDVAGSPAWKTVGRIIEVAAGLILLVIAFSGLFAGLLTVCGWHWLGLSDAFNEVIAAISSELDFFPRLIQPTWVKALAAVVYTMPFIGMLYASIMMLFSLKAPSWHPGLWMVLLWILSLVALLILVVLSAIPQGGL